MNVPVSTQLSGKQTFLLILLVLTVAAETLRSDTPHGLDYFLPMEASPTGVSLGRIDLSGSGLSSFQETSFVLPGDSIPSSPRPGDDVKWYTMFTKIPSDWSLFARRTFTSENIPAIAGVTALTATLYVFDENTYHDMRSYTRNSSNAQTLADAFISVGDGKYQFGFIATMAVYGLASDDSRSLRTAGRMTEAVVAAGIVVQVLKRISGRESPIVSTHERGALRPFPSLATYQHNQPRYYSFPSGHIATTTASFTVLCESFPEARWLRPVSYVVIGAVGASLVSNGWHWYSDLPLGAVLGYSFGMIAAHPEWMTEKKDENENSTGVRIMPMFSPDGARVALAVNFDLSPLQQR